MSRFFPEPTALQRDSWHLDDTATRLILRVTSTPQVVPCPGGAVLTPRVHSRSTRTLAERPWGVARGRWPRRVRTCGCANAPGPRRLWTERRPAGVAPWARRTRRLLAWRIPLGLALGGAAGVRLRRRVGGTRSRPTLRRRIRRLPLAGDHPPRVLGVDDFARRQRQPAGTVLLDLARRQPVALWPDREAGTWAPWRRAHPGVEGITRARARADAEGAHLGAPEAAQGADRCHRLQKLGEALEQVFQTPHQARAAVHDAIRRQEVSLADGTGAVAVPPPLPARQEQTAQRRARRVECPQQGWAWHDRGWPGPAMAPPLGLGTHTGCRDRRTTPVPERRRRGDRGHRVLHPDTPSLLARGNAGCQEALRLGGAIPPQGDPGSDATVARSAQRVRQAQGQAPRPRRRRPPLPVVAEPHPRRLTARPGAWLVVRPEEPRTKDDAQPRAQLRAPHADVAEAIDRAQDVAHLVRQRQPQELEPWRARAAKRPVGAWRRLATGRRDDFDAVNAGVTLPWSRGPVEGQITRLKRLTRQMCGRASLARLQRRLVLAPGRIRTSGPHPQASSAVQAPPAAASPDAP